LSSSSSAVAAAAQSPDTRPVASHPGSTTMLAAGPLPPGFSSQRHNPALCELLVVNAVALWVAILLVMDHMVVEAILILLLTLVGHAGIGPSQLR